MTVYYFIAGHGEGDPGAIAVHDGNTYQERQLATDLVERICFKTGCPHYPFEKDAYKHTEELAAVIPLGVTHVVEIHFNAFTSNTAQGTEVWTVPGAREGMPTATLCKKVAEAVGTTDRGVKTSGLKVISKLNSIGMRAALLEVAFVTSPSDMARYNPDKVADAIINALGIADNPKAEVDTGGPRWSDAFMKRMERLKIMTDGRPTDPVTREELAAVICRTLDVIDHG